MVLARRRFLNLSLAGLAASVVSGPRQGVAGSTIQAIAFDGFVILDPRPVADLAEHLFPGKGTELTNLWRNRQFEYTWLRNATQTYVDFWRVTQDALRYAAQALKLDMPREARDALMGAFLTLKAWPDVAPTLTCLKQAGVRLAFLTNLTQEMVEKNVRNAGLDRMFDGILSTDQVRVFKPDPRAYAMGLDFFGLPKERIAFAAFGGWDAAGAKDFGYPTYWCNRMGTPIEELGVAPDRIGPTTKELADFVGQGC